MVDIVNALQNSPARPAERGELQRDWVVSSAECSHRAKEALARAAEVLADHALGQHPDDELARAWAAVGQGWASLSHAEAARSMAVAAFAVDQVGVNTYPTT
jgi:hypothetical protein